MNLSLQLPSWYFMNKLQYKYTWFNTSFSPSYGDLWISSQLGLLLLHCSETDLNTHERNPTFWSSPRLAEPENFKPQSKQWKIIKYVLGLSTAYMNLVFLKPFVFQQEIVYPHTGKEGERNPWPKHFDIVIYLEFLYRQSYWKFC